MFRYKIGIVTITCALVAMKVAVASDAHNESRGVKAETNGEALTRQAAGRLGENKSRKHLRLALRRSVRAQHGALQSVFAVTEQQATEKLIEKLLQDEQAMGASSPLDLESLGFCKETLTPTEWQTLAKSLAPLELPAHRLALMVTESSDPEQRNRVVEQGHRILQSTLGDDRYRSAYKQCRADRNNDFEARSNRANSIFYQFLGLTPEQRTAVSAILTEEEQRLLNEAGDPEADAASYLLNEQGRIPSLYQKYDGVDETYDAAGGDDQQKLEALDAEYVDKLMKILSPEQRELARTSADDLLTSMPLSGSMSRLLHQLVIEQQALNKSK